MKYIVSADLKPPKANRVLIAKWSVVVSCGQLWSVCSRVCGRVCRRVYGRVCRRVCGQCVVSVWSGVWSVCRRVCGRCVGGCVVSVWLVCRRVCGQCVVSV